MREVAARGSLHVRRGCRANAQTSQGSRRCPQDPVDDQFGELPSLQVEEALTFLHGALGRHSTRADVGRPLGKRVEPVRAVRCLVLSGFGREGLFELFDLDGVGRNREYNQYRAPRKRALGRFRFQTAQPIFFGASIHGVV